jgi:hypothetical protein
MTEIRSSQRAELLTLLNDAFSRALNDCFCSGGELVIADLDTYVALMGGIQSSVGIPMTRKLRIEQVLEEIRQESMPVAPDDPE